MLHSERINKRSDAHGNTGSLVFRDHEEHWNIFDDKRFYTYRRKRANRLECLHKPVCFAGIDVESLSLEVFLSDFPLDLSGSGLLLDFRKFKKRLI